MSSGTPRLGQNRLALHGVVGRFGMHLVVEVVQQRGHRPFALVLAEFPGVSRDATFNRQGVLAKAFGFGVLVQDFNAPGLW